MLFRISMIGLLYLFSNFALLANEVNLTSTSLTKMTSCHDCGHENQTKNAAIRAWDSRLNGTVFVYDYINRSMRKYQVYWELVQIDPYLSKTIKRTRRIAMTSAERNSVYKVERVFDELMADSMSIRKGSGGKLLSDIEVLHTSFGNSAYDLMLDRGAMNRHLFDRHYRQGYNVIATWINAATEAFNLPGFDIIENGVTFKLVFPDGSYVLVEPNLRQEKYDIVEAVDGDGHQIKSEPAFYNASGRYFHTNYRFRQFNDYVSELGLRVRNAEIANGCSRVTTRCSISDDGSRVTCIANCN